MRLTCVFKFSRTRTIGPSCTPRRPGGVRPRRSSPESSTGPPGRPPVWACWRLTDGKWWRTRTGARIFERLQAEVDAKGLSAWDVSVDSMMARAISTPTGPVKGDLPKEPPGGVSTEPGDHGLGRSRGGLTTKLHLPLDHEQKPLSLMVRRYTVQRGTSTRRRLAVPYVAGPTMPSADRR